VCQPTKGKKKQEKFEALFFACSSVLGVSQYNYGNRRYKDATDQNLS
jgi:hypothetical protein